MKKTLKILAGLALVSAMAFTSCTFSGDFKSENVALPESTKIFEGGSIRTNGYGTIEVITEKDSANKDVSVFHITAGSWCAGGYTLKTPIDASKATKVKIIAKATNWNPGDAICISFLSDADADGVGNGTRLDSWSDNTFLSTLADGYQIFEYELSKFTNKADDSTARGSSNLTTVSAPVDYAADKITAVVIDPRSATGDLYIGDIIFE